MIRVESVTPDNRRSGLRVREDEIITEPEL